MRGRFRTARRIRERPVVGPPRLRPFAEYRTELRPHGIDPPHRHRPAADGEVVRGELTAALEMARGRLVAPARPQPLAETELGAGLLIRCGRQRLLRTRFVARERGLLAAHPRAERAEMN